MPLKDYFDHMSRKYGTQVRTWTARPAKNQPERCDVFNALGDHVATLAKMPWGKWKLLFEDTYANTPEELIERLKERERRQ